MSVSPIRTLVFIHNFRGSDSHLIMQKLRSYKGLTVLRKTWREKTWRTTGNIKFVDSLQS